MRQGGEGTELLADFMLLLLVLEEVTPFEQPTSNVNENIINTVEIKDRNIEIAIFSERYKINTELMNYFASLYN